MTRDLPESLREAVEAELGTIGAVTPLGGGCISRAFRIGVAGGVVFLKYEENAVDDFFLVEAEGLQRLSGAAERIRIPEVLGVGRDRRGMTWLALEWLDGGGPANDLSERLGAGLAEIHSSGSGSWGWHRDGYIGRLPQSNRPVDRWASFWKDERLLPQLQRAGSGDALGSEDEWSELFGLLPAILAAAEEDGPSLLHGDLWSGNVMTTAEGGPALIDPSAYFGHREVDLAMTELFGGFDRAFRLSYEAEWPLRPGYEGRRPVYQLYYLLVHVNLFGGSYAERTVAALQEALRRGRYA